MTCLLFCERLDALLIEKNFSLDLYAFVILKNLLTSSFLVQVVFKSFFGSVLFRPPSLVGLNALRPPGARAIFLHSNVLYNNI